MSSGSFSRSSAPHEWARMLMPLRGVGSRHVGEIRSQPISLPFSFEVAAGLVMQTAACSPQDDVDQGVQRSDARTLPLNISHRAQFQSARLADPSAHRPVWCSRGHIPGLLFAHVSTSLQAERGQLRPRRGALRTDQNCDFQILCKELVVMHGADVRQHDDC